jgi:hypothetical protein
MTVALEEERWKCLTIMVARAQAHEAMKLRKLLGKAKTDVVTGAALSSLGTSQDLHPSIVLH